MSEVMEARVESKYTPYETVWIDGKPEGLGSELADIIILTAGIANYCNIDLEKDVAEKITYLKRKWQPDAT